MYNINSSDCKRINFRRKILKNILNLIIILALAMSIACFVGCNDDSGSSSSSSSSSSAGAGDDDEGGSAGPSAGPSGMPGGPSGMPGGPAGMPGGPAGMAGGPAGMAGGPAGMPGGAPGMPGMAGDPSIGGGTDSGASAQPQQPKITFDQAPKTSKVQTFTKANGLTYLVFKFADEKGIVYKCKLPKAESLGTWTKREWLSTFKAFRYNTVAENNELAKKMNQEKLGSWSWAVSMGADTSEVLGYPKKEEQQALYNTNTNNFFDFGNTNPNRPGEGINQYGPNMMNPNGMNPMNPMNPNGMNPMGPSMNPMGPNGMGGNLGTMGGGMNPMGPGGMGGSLGTMGGGSTFGGSMGGGMNPMGGAPMGGGMPMGGGAPMGMF